MMTSDRSLFGVRSDSPLLNVSPGKKKPNNCPLCGNGPRLFGSVYEYVFYCEDCNISTARGYKTKKEAREAWDKLTIKIESHERNER